MVSSTPRPRSTPRKDPVPILQEAGWAPGPVWTGGKSRPHRYSIPDPPALIQPLYRLSYRAHIMVLYHNLTRPPSYMRPVVDRNVVMRRMALIDIVLFHRTCDSKIVIIIIFINCNCVVTRWQWLFYMYTPYEIGYY